MNQDDSAVTNAAVDATLTVPPDSTVYSLQGVTDDSGVVEFESYFDVNQSLRAGTFTLTVTDVRHGSYIYDNTQNLETEDFYVFP